MKILLAVHHFPPQYQGGAEWRAFRTAKALLDRGHSVLVVTVETVNTIAVPQIQWTETFYEEIPIHRLTLSLDIPPDRLGWMYINPHLESYFRDLYQSHQTDIFHLIGGYLITTSPLRVAQDMGIPRIVSLTDFWFLCPRIQMIRSDGQLSTLPIRPINCVRCLAEEKRRFRILGRLVPRLMNVYWHSRKGKIAEVQNRINTLKQFLNSVDKIISPSQFLRQFFIEAGIDTERILYSRQGRDFPDLSPELLVKTASPTLRIGYLGQIIEIKGVHTLINAIRKLPHLQLQVKIYGDITRDPVYAHRISQIISNDSRIKYCGTYQTQELSQVFQGLDVIVVPSLWYENSPNIILEAFAHHTPVIASNLGGMAELVEDSVSGLLFPPGDSHALARQIQRLVNNPELLVNFRNQIPMIRTVNQEIDELIEIYSLIDQKNHPVTIQSR